MCRFQCQRWLGYSCLTSVNMRNLSRELWGTLSLLHFGYFLERLELWLCLSYLWLYVIHVTSSSRKWNPLKTDYFKINCFKRSTWSSWMRRKKMQGTSSDPAGWSHVRVSLFFSPWVVALRWRVVLCPSRILNESQLTRNASQSLSFVSLDVTTLRLSLRRAKQRNFECLNILIRTDLSDLNQAA